MVQWKTLAMFVIVLLLFMYTPALINTAAGVISGFWAAVQDAWQSGIRPHRFSGSGNPVEAVAKLAVLGIIVVGITKILRRR